MQIIDGIKYYTVSECAFYLNILESIIRKRVQLGALPVKLGSEEILIDEEVLMSFTKSHFDPRHKKNDLPDN